MQAALSLSLFQQARLAATVVAQISHDYFENAMAHFTNSIFNAIKAHAWQGFTHQSCTTRLFHAPTLQDPWQAHAQLNLISYPSSQVRRQALSSKMQACTAVGSLSCATTA